MVRQYSKRRTLDRAIPLIPTVKEQHVDRFCRDVWRKAHAARSAMDDSIDLYLSAQRSLKEGSPGIARRKREGAALDHRLACSHLLDLALTMRALMEWAAADWRPSRDVQDTGLIREDLRILCQVMGIEEEN